MLRVRPAFGRKDLDRRLPFLVCLGAVGLFFGQANPLIHVPAAVLLFPFALFCAARLCAGAGQSVLAGWSTGFLGYGLALYWLTIPMHDVGELPYVLAVPAELLLAAYLGLYSGMACLAMHRAQTAFTGPVAGALAASLLGGMAFGGSEVLCGWVFTGFPWLTLAPAFAPWPAWIQAAALVGGYGLGAWLAAAACLAAASLRPRASLPGRLALLAAAAVMCAAVPLYGIRTLQQAEPTSAHPELLGVVQGNIDQNQKWEPVYQQTTVTRYLELSEGLLAGRDAAALPVRAVLWPETAMPFYFEADPFFAPQLRAFAARHAVSLGFGVLGSGRTERGAVVLYNRFQLLGPDGADLGHYDKQHLVPFGEYVPFDLDLGFISNMLQGISFSPGRVETSLVLPGGAAEAPEHDAPALSDAARSNGLALGVLICYESIFPRYAQQRVEHGASVLVNVSNDAWFGRSSAPEQHLGHAVIRAVEQGRPLVRPTNTGYSALVDARGRVLARSELFREEAFIVPVRPETGVTLYHTIFFWPEALLVLCLFIAFFSDRLFPNPATQNSPCIN